MPQRNCTKEKANITSPTKRITLPLTMGKYQGILSDHRAYRKWIDEMIAQYPELFPKEIVGGYTLHDERTSEKMHYRKSRFSIEVIKSVIFVNIRCRLARTDFRARFGLLLD